MFFNTENLFKFAYHLTNQPKPNTMTNYITVQTKGNYKHANGIKLEVVQFLSHMISAKVPEYGYNQQGEPQGSYITADFQLKEITSITSN